MQHHDLIAQAVLPEKTENQIASLAGPNAAGEHYAYPLWGKALTAIKLRGMKAD
ncbi:hypothetical protein OH773_13710 [Buttiauxella sp. WJP83]|uniref:hypothetical protein n=1 Tax=Buttiauxella sp. WJP83 TaxID=2986951 RepID=UPI0022DD6769|nr:hypothetical protein [Buttiauxella sp. WJP83]WBM69235.1 hypothetical protein OH773_13710 [Buttiauxella sp. WJP83]